MHGTTIKIKPDIWKWAEVWSP